MEEIIIIPQIKATIIQIVALVRLLIVVIGASLKILRPMGPLVSAGDNHVTAGCWLDYRLHKLTEIQFVIRGSYVELRVRTDSGSNEVLLNSKCHRNYFTYLEHRHLIQQAAVN
jgi:hypothetical protein